MMGGYACVVTRDEVSIVIIIAYGHAEMLMMTDVLTVDLIIYTFTGEAQ